MLSSMETGTSSGTNGHARYGGVEAADPEELQPFTSDFLHLKRSPKEPAPGTTLHQRLLDDRRSLIRSSIVIAGGVLGFLLVVGVVVVSVLRSRMLSTPQGATSFNSWCITPLGAGLVGDGGNFGHFNSTSCVLQLRQYFVPGGAYTREVELVAGMATSFFQTQPKPDPSQLVVFDIDETVLSNQASFFSADNRVMPRESHDEGKAAGNLPALAPMLQLYTLLYRHNYSVAFVTGRAEPFRQATATNLAAAGFGKACPAGGGRRKLAVPYLHGAVPPPETEEDRPDTPCYSALLLRTADDVPKYASVYKPEARGAMRALGYEIVGNFGDQFSDLVGENAATPGSFKMPNPVYYIV